MSAMVVLLKPYAVQLVKLQQDSAAAAAAPHDASTAAAAAAGPSTGGDTPAVEAAA